MSYRVRILGLLGLSLIAFAGCEPSGGNGGADGGAQDMLPVSSAGTTGAAAGQAAVPGVDGGASSGGGDSTFGDGGVPGVLDPNNPGTAPSACVQSYLDQGMTSLCGSCACGRCTEASDACLASGDAKADETCGAVVRCAIEHHCTGMACYCGEGLNETLCALAPNGPCKMEIEAAAGKKTMLDVQTIMNSGDKNNAWARAVALDKCMHGTAQPVKLGMCTHQCVKDAGACNFDDEGCQDMRCKPDDAREDKRLQSSMESAMPVIDSISVGGSVVWSAGDTTKPTLKPGDTITLAGSGFGSGVDIDFSKILVGNARVLETDLTMYDQKLDIAKQVNYELSTKHGEWPKDIVSWSDSQIVFKVPQHATSGALLVQVQKRIGHLESLLRPGEAQLVVDALTFRITDPAFQHKCDVVSELSKPVASEPIEVTVSNPGFEELVTRGREVFWSYDYNIGTAHAVRGLDWKKIFAGETMDPITGKAADPYRLFNAFKTVRGEVPDEAMDDVHFDPYPQPSPIPGLLTIEPQLLKGKTRDSGWVGYRYAESSHPYQGKGEWIGFNCASCHGYRISYEKTPGQNVTKVFPGLPNPGWSMKWTLLGNFKGVKGNEPGPLWDPDTVAIDKTAIVYAMPEGAGEHNVIRAKGEGSHTDNDYQFSPIAIPSVTHYLPVRRSLGHTESYVGFEGSYIHSEEPDGAMGSMHAKSLQALTAYMSTLDRDDDDLRNVGMYRWLKDQGLLAAEVGAAVSEGQFVQTGWEGYAGVSDSVARGEKIFESQCGSCHTDEATLNSNERMFRLDVVGHFFAPTIYQKEIQAVRTTFLRDLYWVQHRGLLSDGHVRNLEDLVNPDRCTEGSELYDAYYTLHEPKDPGPLATDERGADPSGNRRGDVFRVIKTKSTAAGDVGDQRNRFVKRHKYFSEVPWDPDHYYWDYQKMRSEYGPYELGTSDPIGMPAAPHPWCAKSQAEVDDLMHYLLTL